VYFDDESDLHEARVLMTLDNSARWLVIANHDASLARRRKQTIDRGHS
jgi:hypothetical protein